MNIPIPHTKNVAIFSKIAGVEYLDSLKKSGKYMPGCYRIWSSFGNSDNLYYIGQSIYLGMRIKYQAKSQNNSTYDLCFNLGDKVKVDLYILPLLIEIPAGLSITEFLCVLE